MFSIKEKQFIADEWYRCPDCDGVGWYTGTEAIKGEDGLPEPSPIQVQCERCGGSGSCGSIQENIIYNQALEDVTKLNEE